jgi:hypothetical protein
MLMEFYLGSLGQVEVLGLARTRDYLEVTIQQTVNTLFHT